MPPDENTAEEPQTEPEDTSPAQEPAAQEPESEYLPRRHHNRYRSRSGAPTEAQAKRDLHRDLARTPGPVKRFTAVPETFPRSYVEELRQENGKYRQRAQKADAYAQRLHTELVRASGKLADPTDLPFDEVHLDDVDALRTAIEELLARKPHLASRRPTGDIGQGATPSTGAFDLAALLRQRVR